jgi:hypothetical protein
MSFEFNPANALIRMGYESIPGIEPTTWHDHMMVSESLSSDAPTIQRASITQASQRPMGAPTKISCNGDLQLEFDPESYMRYLANLQKHGSVTNPASGVYAHKLAPSETDEDYPASIGVEVWRDDGSGHRFADGRVANMEFSLAPRSFLKTKVGLIFARADYWSAPTEVEDGTTPNTVKLQIRGLPQYDDWTTESNGALPSLWVKVTDITNIATGSIKVKSGYGTVTAGPVQVAPSPYPSDESIVYVGNDADGQPIWNALGIAGAWVGDRAMPIEVHLSDSTGYQVNDEYRFDVVRPIWVPDYPDVPVFNEIFAFIYIDGTKYQIQDFTASITSPVQPIEAIGGRYAWTTRTRGMREVSIKLGREYLSTTLRKRLETGTPFLFRCDAYTGNEFETGYEHELHLVSPQCVAGGKTPTVGGQSDMKESVDATCHPDPENTDGYVDDITIEVQNSEADLEAV